MRLCLVLRAWADDAFPSLALIGSGTFARETYLPHFEQHGADRIVLTAALSRTEASLDQFLAAYSRRDGVERFAGAEGEEAFFLVRPSFLAGSGSLTDECCSERESCATASVSSCLFPFWASM